MKNYRSIEPRVCRVSAQLALAIIAASTVWAQGPGTAQATPTVAEPKKAPSTDGAIQPGDEVIELSPFQVEATSRGYEASNTMSGTRINSKIEDIAASISVITKAQLDDNASLDINDVFRHEVSTEGMAQFTQFTIDRNFCVVFST
jgi:outer membrane receptor for ferric coprogen and ferric-rhodotorulic acid